MLSSWKHRFVLSLALGAALLVERLMRAWQHRARSGAFSGR